MSTAFYLYHIPSGSYPIGDWRRNLVTCLDRKELIGVRTLQGDIKHRKRVFTWAMHPGKFLYDMHFYGEFHAVTDEYGNMELLPAFFTMLKDMDIIKFDKENIPA